jgi:tRNA(Arg) A34 adenosine deaminase TadA
VHPQRRGFVAGLSAAIGAAWAWSASTGRAHEDRAQSVAFVPAGQLSAEERARHERYMAMALELAEDRPGPFAAVIVDRRTGEVVCRGLNANRQGNRIQHGEIVAINACAAAKPEIEWRDAVLYTTAEPCPMCMSAIVWTAIPEVVYGTSIETLIGLGINQFRLDSPTVAAAAPFYSARIVGGILAERTDEMYRNWAAERRR